MKNGEKRSIRPEWILIAGSIAVVLIEVILPRILDRENPIDVSTVDQITDEQIDSSTNSIKLEPTYTTIENKTERLHTKNSSEELFKEISGKVFFKNEGVSNATVNILDHGTSNTDDFGNFHIQLNKPINSNGTILKIEIRHPNFDTEFLNRPFYGESSISLEFEKSIE